MLIFQHLVFLCLSASARESAEYHQALCSRRTNGYIKFALGVLWGVPATAVLLIIVYIALQHSLHLFLSIAGWLLSISIQNYVLDYITGIVD